MTRSRVVRAVLCLTVAAGACGDDASPEPGQDGGAQPTDAAVADTDAATGAEDAGTDGGAGPGDPRHDREGDRLRALGYAVDGMFVRTGIYDDALEVSCEFFEPPMAGAPGLYCVPTTFTEMRYANADCTGERLYARDRGGCSGALSEGAVVRAADASACGEVLLKVRAVGAPAGDAMYYRRDFGTGQCVADTDGGGTVYVAEPADFAQLVAGQVEVVDSGEAGLELEVTVGSDGSRFAGGLRWSAGPACEPLRVASDADAPEPCVPRQALSASTNTYADSACSEVVFIGTVNPSCESTGQWDYGLVYAEQDGCQVPSALHRLAASLSTLYVGPPESCAEHTSVPETWRSFAAGEAVAFDSVPGTLRRFVGASRLRVEHVTTRAGDPIVSSQGYFDAELNGACHPRRFADGRTRCVPSNTVWEDGSFADADCNVPAYVSFVGGCNPAREAARYTVTEGTDSASCTSHVTGVRHVVAHTGTVYMRGENGVGCEARVLDPSQAAFVDGDAIATEALVEIEVVGP